MKKRRLNIYTILRLILIIFFVIFIYKEYQKIMIEVKKNTEEIVKTIEIRESDFINDEKLKAEINSKNIPEVLKTENEAEENTKEIENEVSNDKRKNDEDLNVNNQEINEKDNLNENLKNNEQTNKNQQNQNIKEKIKEVKPIKARYIHAATFKTEKDAKTEVERLGKDFRVKAVKEKDRTIYQVVSITTIDSEKFSEIEKQVKRGGSKYFVRMVGK